MEWSPNLGTTALVERLGHDGALGALTGLLAGEVSLAQLCQDPWRQVVIDIGDGHATRLMSDPTGARLVYWPRVWAARSLAYLGDAAASPHLLDATQDSHWRVRMMAIQAVGRLGIEGVTERLTAALDDQHERVRSAAVVALGRVGDADAIKPLVKALPNASDDLFGRVDRALQRLQRRGLGPLTRRQAGRGFADHR